jgi:hypothetical protein
VEDGAVTAECAASTELAVLSTVVLLTPGVALFSELAATAKNLSNSGMIWRAAQVRLRGERMGKGSVGVSQIFPVSQRNYQSIDKALIR